MEATLEVFADKITSAFRNEDSDLLLKMQAAQHEHDHKMFMMLSQFMERSSHPPQPPHYQAPMQSSQLYNPRHPPSHHSSLFPMASASSPASVLSPRFKSATALQQCPSTSVAHSAFFPNTGKHRRSVCFPPPGSSSTLSASR